VRGVLASLALLVSLAAGAQPVAAAGLDPAEFRYQRSLVADSGGGPVLIEPDGALFEHSAPGFADLRIADARGRAVPWRRIGRRPRTVPGTAAVLNSGRQGRLAVALIDLGPRPGVRDRMALAIPDRGFVGRAVVLGSDDRDGPFTRLSATGIYDVRGAHPARSTVAIFPPSDFRFLWVRASGVSRIAGARVSGARERPPMVRRTVRSVTRREAGSRTIVTLDLGFRGLPVDELRVGAATARYVRSVAISGSDDRRRFRPLTTARISRFQGSGSAPISVDARLRHIRIEVDNGDDAPLRGIEVSAWSRSHRLLVEGGHPRPYTVRYGNPRAHAPSYDFARFPVGALGVERAVRGQLGAEQGIVAFEPPPDRRSFWARNPGFLTAALAFAAFALGGVGLLVLRSRT